MALPVMAGLFFSKPVLTGILGQNEKVDIVSIFTGRGGA